MVGLKWERSAWIISQKLVIDFVSAFDYIVNWKYYQNDAKGDHKKLKIILNKILTTMGWDVIHLLIYLTAFIFRC